MTTPHTHTERALPAGTWQLDPSRTTITVAAKKLGFFTVPATLAVSSGTIEIDANHQVTAVDIVADAMSYTSKNTKRNDHIRGADFLDAANHPELVFGAGKVSRTSTGYRAEGTVTVKGQVVPTSVDVTDVDADADRGSFVATATIDRNAIGVDKLPSLVIGRDLHMTVTATAFIAKS